MRKVLFFFLLFSKVSVMNAQHKASYSISHPIYFSQDFLYTVKTDGDMKPYMDSLANLDRAQLKQKLNSPAEKLSFWLNMYNGLAQFYLQEERELFAKNRNHFFHKKYIIIGGEKLSLDLIENGILRRSRFKYGLGYIGKLFPSSVERMFRVDTVDARIHFGLNCGASSCPAIAFYKPEEINEQLDLAAKVYLKSEIMYDKEKDVIYLPTILSWFKGDFGGKKGLYKLLEKYAMIQPGVKPKLKFKKYDWTLQQKKFSE